MKLRFLGGKKPYNYWYFNVDVLNVTRHIVLFIDTGNVKYVYSLK